MLWLLLFWMATAALLVPVRLTADVHHGARKLLRLTVAVAGLRRQWLLEVSEPLQGRQLTVCGREGPARTMDMSQMGSGPWQQAMQLLRRNKPARRFLMRHIHLHRLDAQLLLHTASAASTALLTGAVQTLAACMQPGWRSVTRLRVLPDFLRERSTLQAKCIFSLRPGTLLITACLLLADAAAQAINRRERAIWNTPSEN